MRILICGSTYFLDYDFLKKNVLRILDEKNIKVSDVLIISGMAKGADTLAVEFAEEFNLEWLEFWADWNRYKKGAGPIRNQRMLDEGKPDLIIGFPMPGSKGTHDMMNRGRLEGLEVIEIEYEDL